ncbi:hypothetical protein FOZ62_004763 [Perkinsus olseni]|uniref:Uncharacterized protein n=1 Tax=Perkinsus olseni TaxID=32597 RepID=A0A7J6PS30_PEROL|nr:hypothetical protein FOZ62_004763 [Perkinsus olseni]
MSPESEGASGGETSTQEKPSCPYLRGEGYTALPTSEGEKAGPTAAPGAAGATATDIGEAKATETSEGEATETSEGEATETSEGEVTKTSEGEATETSEGEVTKTSEGEATETSEGKATETSEGEVTKTSEGEVTKTSEGEVTKTSEGEATETAEGKIIETTTKATEEKASGTSQGKASAATRAETTETSKSEETEILVEVGGTGGPTPAEGWITTPGSASASPSSEELFREHEGLATGIGSHGGERVEASRIPTAAGTTTLPTEPGPITSQPAEEVPYKLVYEPPVLHHGDEPATSWTDERVATHERLEVSTEKPSDSQPLEDASWYRSGEEGSLDIGFWYFRGHDRHRDQHHHDRDHDQHRDHGHRRRHRDDRRQRDHRH